MFDQGLDTTQVYLNGRFLPLKEAHVSVLDRGFIFGDGIYEVVPVYNKRPFRMSEHLDRLERSLAKVRIDAQQNRAYWDQLVCDLIARSAHPYCLVYLQVTRGVARRDHGFPKPPPPATVFGMTSAFQPPDQALRERGLRVIGIEDERWLHCEIKSISLLGNVLAKQQAVDACVDDAIQFRDGYLTEASAANVWAVIDGELVGPPRNNLILEGIRYALMHELAVQQKIAVRIRPVVRAEVYAASELLLTSAGKEVLPVVELDGQPVGTGTPGPIYHKLRAAYDQCIAELQRTTTHG
jgi:D-alanine transaminase